MRYDFTRITAKDFETLCQALIRAEFGPGVTQFGSGPDKGRETTWRGTFSPAGDPYDWTGYGVVQVKAKEVPSTPARDLTWLKREITKEVSDWASVRKNRQPKPEILLFMTNVTLSAAKGIDAAQQHLEDELSRNLLEPKTCAIWHQEDISRLLDAHPGVRRSYAALVSTGDVIMQLLDSLESRASDVANAIESYTAKMLTGENSLNLTQAGSATDNNFTLFDAYTDLPISVDQNISTEALFEAADQAKTAVSLLIERANVFNEIDGQETEDASRRTAIIGGPGQGKSTVTQYLAQIYRAEYLRSCARARSLSSIDKAIVDLDESRDRIEVAPPSFKRWPFRIAMTDLADQLSKGACTGVIGFIVNEVNRRSTMGLTIQEMSAWLKSYPWLLIIDGLDEVPQSSNRSQVLQSINDFFVDATTLGADVHTVVTTRPQGYNYNFDPTKYRHYVLDTLDPDDALRFARSFIRLRLASDVAKQEQVERRFHDASKSALTARLMFSPLQIIILVILIESKGRVAEDRWRLFDSYYKVITNREHQKPGALSTLLSNHEDDIHVIHRQVGYILQSRSSDVGSTSSHMPISEFHELVENRLVVQGYTEEGARELRTQIVSLATERLVFLTFATEDSVGFELRSLQEFMAGEFVQHLPESETIPKMAELAVKSHWRNAMLFAFGAIFASREPLREKAILLCEDLDFVEESRYTPPLGSTYALEILLDGACAHQPKLERNLTRRALNLINSTYDPSLRRFSNLATISSVAEELIVQELQSSAEPKSINSIINRATVLDQMAADGRDVANLIETLVAEASGEHDGVLVSAAIRNPGGALAHAVDQVVRRLPPSYLMTFAERDLGQRTGPADDTTSRLLDALQRFTHNRSDIGLYHSYYDASDPHSFRRSIEIGGRWRRVQTAPSETRLWEGTDLVSFPDDYSSIPAVREFCFEPSARTLSQALVVISRSPFEWVSTSQACPWPLMACVLTVQNKSIGLGLTDDEAREELAELSKLAEKGHLGDTSDWVELENKESIGSSNAPDLKAFYRMSPDTVATLPGPSSPFPIEILIALNPMIQIAADFDEFREYVDYSFSLIDAASGWPTGQIQDLLLRFAANVLVAACNVFSKIDPDHPYLGDRPDLSERWQEALSEEDELVFERARTVLSKVRHFLIPPRSSFYRPLAYTAWMPLVPIGKLGEWIGSEILDSLGSAERIMTVSARGHVPELIEMWEKSGREGLLLLAFLADAEVVVAHLSERQVAAATDPHTRTACVTAVSRALDSEIVNGAHDTELMEFAELLAFGGAGLRDVRYSLLPRAISALAPSKSAAIFFRLSLLMRSRDPFAAHDLLEMARTVDADHT